MWRGKTRHVAAMSSLDGGSLFYFERTMRREAEGDGLPNVAADVGHEAPSGCRLARRHLQAC